MWSGWVRLVLPCAGQLWHGYGTPRRHVPVGQEQLMLAGRSGDYVIEGRWLEPRAAATNAPGGSLFAADLPTPATGAGLPGRQAVSCQRPTLDAEGTTEPSLITRPGPITLPHGWSDHAGGRLALLRCHSYEFFRVAVSNELLPVGRGRRQSPQVLILTVMAPQPAEAADATR